MAVIGLKKDKIYGSRANRPVGLLKMSYGNKGRNEYNMKKKICLYLRNLKLLYYDIYKYPAIAGVYLSVI